MSYENGRIYISENPRRKLYKKCEKNLYLRENGEGVPNF